MLAVVFPDTIENIASAGWPNGHESNADGASHFQHAETKASQSPLTSAKHDYCHSFQNSCVPKRFGIPYLASIFNLCCTIGIYISNFNNE